MAESSRSMVSGPDISDLEQAIYAQQQLLQKLNHELEIEREAAATAASEALSMILRLQGEKASLKMEASQYKRMAEEKMCHAEESLAVFEDLTYQRELEIASLEFQVQACRYRLLSMGYNDLGVYENVYPENLLMLRNDNLFTEKIVNSNAKILNSLPQVATKEPNQKKNPTERKRPVTPVADSPMSPFEEHSIQESNDLEKKTGSYVKIDLDSCWEQIKMLDERVKELSDNKDSRGNKPALWKGETWSPSLFSQVSIGISIDAATDIISDQDKNHEDVQIEDDCVDSPCSSNVQDIFEVPQPIETRKVKKDYSKLTLKSDKLGKPDSPIKDAVESPSLYETDRAKAAVLSACQEKKLRPKPSSERSVSPVLRLGNSPPELNQLSRRIERLERARSNARQEIVSAAGEEELNLLKEIREQLKSMDSEIKSWKVKQSPVKVEPSLDPLQEAMLYFWM